MRVHCKYCLSYAPGRAKRVPNITPLNSSLRPGSSGLPNFCLGAEVRAEVERNRIRKARRGRRHSEGHLRVSYAAIRVWQLRARQEQRIEWLT